MKRKNNIDGISIQSFVRDYLGTEHSCSKLKHQGLKSFDNPYVIGASNDFALKNFDYVVRNELIIVIDDYGNPGTYINPNNIKKLIELETNKEKLKLISGINCHNFEEANLLFQVWDSLNNNIKYLEGLYSSTNELLRILNKGKLIKNIKKKAKEEAKRTLIFTTLRTNENSKQVTAEYESKYEEEDYQDEDYKLIFLDHVEGEQVTEKINRQKRLDSMKRIG